MNVVSSLSTFPIRTGKELSFLHIEVCNTSGFLTTGKPLAFFACAVTLKDTNSNSVFGSNAKDFILKENGILTDNDYFRNIADELRLHILSEIIKNFRPINRQFQNFRYFVNIHFLKDVTIIDPKIINRTSEYVSEIKLDEIDNTIHTVRLTRSIDRLEYGASEFFRLAFTLPKKDNPNVYIEFKELLPPHVTMDKRQLLCDHIHTEITKNYGFLDPKFQLRQYFAQLRVKWVKQI